MCPHVTQCMHGLDLHALETTYASTWVLCFLLLWPHLPMCYRRTQAGEQVQKSIMTSFKFCLSHLVRLIAGRPERTRRAAVFVKPFYSLSSVLQAPGGQEISGEDKAKHKDDFPSELSSPACPDCILSAFSSLEGRLPGPARTSCGTRRCPLRATAAVPLL